MSTAAASEGTALKAEATRFKAEATRFKAEATRFKTEATRFKTEATALKTEATALKADATRFKAEARQTRPGNCTPSEPQQIPDTNPADGIKQPRIPRHQRPKAQTRQRHMHKPAQCDARIRRQGRPPATPHALPKAKHHIGPRRQVQRQSGRNKGQQRHYFHRKTHSNFAFIANKSAQASRLAIGLRKR